MTHLGQHFSITHRAISTKAPVVDARSRCRRVPFSFHIEKVVAAALMGRTLAITLACLLLSVTLAAVASAGAAPTVLSVSPDKAANFQATCITITGSNFAATPQGRLNNVWLQDLTFVNSTTLTATVPADLPAGTYSVTITNPDAQAATLTDAFQVVASGNGALAAWQTTSYMVKKRSGAATTSWNDYIYTAGGSNETDGRMSSVEYARVNSDGTVGLWQLTNPMSIARQHFALVARSGYLYAIGGNISSSPYTVSIVERSAINTDGSLAGWQVTSPLVVARYSLAAVTWGSYIYALGGTDGVAYHNTVERAVVNSDGSLGDWEVVSSMQTPRAEFGAVVAGDHIFVVGGSDGSWNTNSVSKSAIGADGTLGSWQSATSMNTARGSFGTALAVGTIYAIGGQDLSGNYLATVEKASVDSNGFLGPWQFTSGLYWVGRRGLGAVAVRGYVYGVDGYRYGDLNSIERAKVSISAPNLTSFSPIAIPSSSDSLVTGVGSGFLPPFTVRLGDSIPLSASFITTSTLTVTVPSGLASGWYTATLTNPDGQTTVLTNALLVDGTAPTGSVVINGGAAHSNSQLVSLTVSSSDAGSGPDQMSFSSDGLDWANWQAYGPTAAWNLAPGDGIRTVFARFKDKVGNISASVMDDILVDTLAPSGSVLINAGATYATTSAASLSLSSSDEGSGVAQMSFSSDGTTWGGWQGYAADAPWTLSGSDGTKTACARFKDQVGNISGAACDTITLDTQGPTASVTALAPFQPSLTFLVEWSGVDPTSGIANSDVQYRDGAAGAWTDWHLAITQGQASFTGQGGHTYFFRVRATDNAGNSGSFSAGDAHTTIDITAPTASIASLAAFQATLTFPVNWSGEDGASGISKFDVQFRDGAAGVWTDWLIGTAQGQANFTGQDGHTYFFRARSWDTVGNVGSFSPGNSQTTIDVSPPTGAITILALVPGGGPSSLAVLVSLQAFDGVSGVESMKLSNDPGFTGAGWEPFASSRTWMLRPNGMVYVRFRDSAGNVSQVYSTSPDRLSLPFLMR